MWKNNPSLSVLQAKPVEDSSTGFADFIHMEVWVRDNF